METIYRLYTHITIGVFKNKDDAISLLHHINNAKIEVFQNLTPIGIYQIINNQLYFNDNVVELEGYLNKWFNNETLKNNKCETWNRFLDIINKADKVIFLDAFTSKLTTDFINCFENNKHSIFELIHEPITRDVKELDNINQWVREIMECLKQNKKAFVLITYNKFL